MDRLVQLPNGPGADRRSCVRYPLTLELRYSVSNGRAPVVTGTGRLIDLSNSGLRFVAPEPLEPGLKIDITLDWPVLLDRRVQLQLIASGVVVWSNATATAIQIHRHHYQTLNLGLNAATR